MLFKSKEINDENDIKVVNQIRALGIDMINEAKSGHSGIVLGAAPILYTLYSKHMKINPDDPEWINRDRFVMSSGHGSALLYSTLYLCGYPIELEDLKKFRQVNSNLPGHPEYGVTPGVDATTGPLGQGVGMAVGMAIAEEYLRNTLKKEGEPTLNYYTYCLAGDGDLMEGVSYEALSLAGTLKLKKLIILYDNNKATLDNSTEITFTEDIKKRMESFGFDVIEVTDGEDINSIDKAIEKAKSNDKPTFISIRTTIGKYSNYEGKNEAHGKIFNEEEIALIKEKLDVRDIPFTISNDAHEYFKTQVKERNQEQYDKFKKECDEYLEKPILNKIISKEYKLLINNLNLNLNELDDTVSLREISEKIINSIESPLFVGGSCDLFSCCKNYQHEKGDFTSKNREGKNIWFGVREHASGAIVNGMLLSGLRAYTSTFLSFSDYLRPSIRLAAIMNLPAIYIFTHDSISVGEDGPTHQPVEQLDSLRLIPNVEVFRPADTNELIGTYKAILAKDKGVSIIVLPRNKIMNIPSSSIKDTLNGGYVISEEEGPLNGIFISSGEDIQTAIELKKRFLINGMHIRVVSMPSTNRFDKMSDEYKLQILPNGVSKYAIEASTALSYLKYVKDEKRLIKINNFGISGKKNDVLKEMKFDVDSIENKISQ